MMHILHIPSSDRRSAKAPAARDQDRERLIQRLRTVGDLPKGMSTRGMSMAELVSLQKPIHRAQAANIPMSLAAAAG